MRVTGRRIEKPSPGWKKANSRRRFLLEKQKHKKLSITEFRELQRLQRLADKEVRELDACFVVQ
jgi:hypothetical protein